MRRVAVLGSTGSIGVNTLDVVGAHRDEFRVESLAARGNIDLLERQVRTFAPRVVSVASEGAAKDLARRVRGTGVEVCWGGEGLVRAAADGADLVVSAIVGAAGLLPTMAAVQAGKDLALANKESLVMAGELVTAEAARRQARILPVDSEHSAIFQCLDGRGRAGVKRIILTASGGPFRTRARSSFAAITPEEALRHPTWKMGRKITIDSATLMNKGLEVIEARWLFGLPPEQIDVIIHPQSIIHSLVEFVDGSLLSQLGITDMRLPILYALAYPRRQPSRLPSLDLAQIGTLTFEAVDRERFRCLDLAYAAASAGGSAPTVLNAANEVAVHRFLEGRLGFDEIPNLIEKALGARAVVPIGSVEEVLEIDREVRRRLERDHT